MTKERKDGVREGSRSSAVFKTGAISLVFLVIGYQAALFINRAAMLGIEAARDRPDTVYVVRHVAAAAEPAPEADASSVREPAGPGLPEGARVLRTDTLKRESAHAPLIMEARRRTRRVENFEFDPNSVSVEDLMRLGFSEKQAPAQERLREVLRGDRFRLPQARTLYKDTEGRHKHRRLGRVRRPSRHRPVLRREDDGVPQPARGLLLPGTAAGHLQFRRRALRRPEGPDRMLRAAGPYIRSRQTADAIVLYRENTPAGSLSVEELAAAGILSEEDAARLARCRIAAPNVSGDD